MSLTAISKLIRHVKTGRHFLHRDSKIVLIQILQRQKYSFSSPIRMHQLNAHLGKENITEFCYLKFLESLTPARSWKLHIPAFVPIEVNGLREALAPVTK